MWSSDKLNAKYEATREIGLGCQAKVYKVTKKEKSGDQKIYFAVKAISKSNLAK